MTLKIDLTPQETAWLNSQAQYQGVPPTEIVKRLIDAQVATTRGLAPISPRSRN